MKRILGIYREISNSPNRETDDELLLKAVIEALRGMNFDAQAVTPEQADDMDLSEWDIILPMCESYPRLMRLKKLRDTSAVAIINEPAAVLSCYRTSMIPALLEAGVNIPPTEIRSVTAGASARPPDFGYEGGVWVKRGDVHNTCLRDVVFARSGAETEAIRQDFERREISKLILQKHIDGDLIKFYGAGPGQWFTWFYHDPDSSRRLPFDIDTLADTANAAAKATGLEIFGGDAIVSPEGPLYLIDINSWPSFARVRSEAARQARWLVTSLSRRRAGRFSSPGRL